MTKRVIAFDCDDVIVASGKPCIDYYNRLHETNVKPENFYSKDYQHIWQADPETATRDLFAYLHTDDYANLSPMANAAETLRKLAERYTLYIVTGRPDETEQATHDWVN